MIAFILARIVQAVPVVLIVGLIAYATFAYVSDPVTIMLSQDYTAAQKAALIHQFGLDQPFYVQYARYIWHALHGEFGVSYRLARPVSTLLAERLPATLELASTASLLALAVGLPMGVYAGLRRDSPLSRVFMVFSLVGVSLPTFLIGILLILVFSVVLGWLPSFGRGDVVNLGGWTTGFLTISGVKALVLPAITLGLFQMTLVMRLVRAEMLEVLRSGLHPVRPRPRPAPPRDHLRPRAPEHARPRHHHRRPAARRRHRLLDRHRDRVPVARRRPPVPPKRAERRHPGHVRLPYADLGRVRGHQPGRGLALLRR